MVLHDQRTVVHMDLDSFFVSVERIRDSRLSGKPLIIGGTSGRGVVASCSYEARRFGVHSAMPMRLARQLCPEATVISGDMEAYSQYSGMVTEIIRDQSPLFEKASIDEFYVDLTGMERFFGAYKWAGDLKGTINRETGLPLSFGLAINKMVAKVATGEAKPDGEIQIKQGAEPDFLAPLPVRRIPMVGEKTGQMLANMGVKLIRTLREIPTEYLNRIMGKSGYVLSQRARGVDPSPIVPYSERKSISTERTFQSDTIDVYRLRAFLTRMTEKLAFDLRKSNKLTACVTVKVRYSDFNTYTKQARIAYCASDHVLTKKVLELFDQLYERRVLVRLVGVRFSHLIQGGHQINLFEDTEQDIRLYEAIDVIKHKYGASAVMRASALC